VHAKRLQKQTRQSIGEIVVGEGFIRINPYIDFGVMRQPLKPYIDFGVTAGTEIEMGKTSEMVQD